MLRGIRVRDLILPDGMLWSYGETMREPGSGDNVLVSRARTQTGLHTGSEVGC
jgi:hypothetical protein